MLRLLARITKAMTRITGYAQDAARNLVGMGFNILHAQRIQKAIDEATAQLHLEIERLKTIEKNAETMAMLLEHLLHRGPMMDDVGVHASAAYGCGDDCPRCAWDALKKFWHESPK